MNKSFNLLVKQNQIMFVYLISIYKNPEKNPSIKIFSGFFIIGTAIFNLPYVYISCSKINLIGVMLHSYDSYISLIFIIFNTIDILKKRDLYS